MNHNTMPEAANRPPQNRGIPTVYEGVQFRSRLEARWAAFFDGIGWSWEYEPIDLDGYIPDFVLPFRYAPLLVEVKPANSYGMKVELLEHSGKLMASGWGQEAAIVGARLGAIGGGEHLCGVLGSRESIQRGASPEWLWDDAALFWCVPCRGLSMCQANGSWRCRRCGVDDGQHRGSIPDGVVNDAWREAGNVVQWRGRQ